MENELARLRRQLDDLQSENLRLRHEVERAGGDRSAAALHQSEEKFRLAFQTSPDSINFNRLADGVYLDINEGFTKLTGYTRADAIGKSSVDLGVWCNPEERACLVKALTSDGCVENFEARFKRKNGEVGIGLMSARVLTTDGEQVILSITRDITERKKTEEELHENLLFSTKLRRSPASAAGRPHPHTYWREGVRRIIRAPGLPAGIEEAGSTEFASSRRL